MNVTDRATEAQRLAAEIAEEDSCSIIEIYCQWVVEGNVCWYDTRHLADEEDDRDYVDRAVRYLDLTGSLERRKSTPHLVGFRA